MRRRLAELLPPILAASALLSCVGGASAPIAKLDTSLEDGRLSAAVRTAVLNDPDLGLRPIAIEVRHGVVTMSGRVRTADEVARAAALARSVPGVREVRNELWVGAGGHEHEPMHLRVVANRALGP